MEEGGWRRGGRRREEGEGREDGEGGGGRRRETGSFIPGSDLTWAQSTMAKLPTTHAQINTETQKHRNALNNSCAILDVDPYNRLGPSRASLLKCLL